MYRVIFMNKHHKVDSTYTYNTFNEAEEQLKRFLHDDSNLYSNISIMDDTQTIKEIILFNASGHMYNRIYDGDVVRIRAEFRINEEEGKYLYTVKNIHEDTQRCLISCINSKLSLGSSEMVDLEMIEVVYHK